MPAASFDTSAAAAAAIILHTMVGHDGFVGASADEDGLLISNGFDITTARERVEHKNHIGLVTIALSNNPSVRLQFDAKCYNIESTMGNPHPGKGLPLNGIANYITAYRAEVTAHESSWWELMEPSMNVPSGDLNTCRFTANLWNPGYLDASSYVYWGND
jgi:hypothetical protein